MAINVIVQYDDRSLLDNLLWTKARIFVVWFDGTIILMFCYVWWLCMATNNVSVQYKGLLPDIILLTQCYYHRGARLNAMKSSPTEITLGQQYDVGEKPTVILYTYINRHAGTPEKH